MEPELNILGLIKLTMAATPPENYAFCNGQTIEISSNLQLYSILGTNFGGDGHTIFKLPQFSPIEGAQYIICTNGTYPARG